MLKGRNESERALYEMREKRLKDKISALNKAKEEGREESGKYLLYIVNF